MLPTAIAIRFQFETPGQSDGTDTVRQNDRFTDRFSARYRNGSAQGDSPSNPIEFGACRQPDREMWRSSHQLIPPVPHLVRRCLLALRIPMLFAVCSPTDTMTDPSCARPVICVCSPEKIQAIPASKEHIPDGNPRSPLLALRKRHRSAELRIRLHGQSPLTPGSTVSAGAVLPGVALRPGATGGAGDIRGAAGRISRGPGGRPTR